MGVKGLRVRSVCIVWDNGLVHVKEGAGKVEPEFASHGWQSSAHGQ
jgi:hypothetical protein